MLVLYSLLDKYEFVYKYICVCVSVCTCAYDVSLYECVGVFVVYVRCLHCLRPGWLCMSFSCTAKSCLMLLSFCHSATNTLAIIQGY